MAVNAVEVAFEEVLDKLAEFEEPKDSPTWEDFLDSQPGPEKTGELGIVMEDDEED